MENTKCKDCIHNGICTIERSKEQIEKEVGQMVAAPHINVIVTCEKWHTTRMTREGFGTTNNG